VLGCARPYSITQEPCYLVFVRDLQCSAKEASLLTRDIDQVIELVRSRFPKVDVVQWQKKWPADDDGIWWFRLPGVAEDIKLESSSGMCPFLIEHDDMQSTDEQWWAGTIGEAARAVMDYLAGQSVQSDLDP
jgi:hypothetical protein